MISQKTWFLNADKSKAVPEGDKDARFLLVREGQEISDADAEKYGVNSKHAEPADSDKAEHTPESNAPESPSENKGGKHGKK